MLFQQAKTDSAIRSVPLTYGEVLPQSVDQLLDQVPLTEEDVFYDLGSGLGKLAIQVFLKSSARKVYGVEILPNLHEYAVSASLKMRAELPMFHSGGRVLTFILGSFLDVPLVDATVVLVASPCFSPAMMQALEKKIEATPSIHSVLTLRPMHGLKRLVFKKAIRVQCSWDSALCYLYQSTIFPSHSTLNGS